MRVAALGWIERLCVLGVGREGSTNQILEKVGMSYVLVGGSRRRGAMAILVALSFGGLLVHMRGARFRIHVP